MRFNKVGYLGRKVITYDEIHQQIVNISWSKVYYNPYKQWSTETVTAGESILKPSIEFQIRACDYSDETFFKDESGNEYTITYPLQQGEYTVIQCERKQANR